jgi:hypothetical protein
MFGIETPKFDRFMGLFGHDGSTSPGNSVSVFAANVFNMINDWTLGLGMPVIILLAVALVYLRSGNVSTTYTISVMAFMIVGGTIYEPIQAVLFIIIGLILTAVLVMFIRGVKTN